MADGATTHAWPRILSALLRGDSLSRSDTDWAMREIMSGEASDAQLAAFAVLLRAKGETSDEMAGLVEAMLAHAQRLDAGIDCVDIVGTGGDGADTVNISTMAALVTAGCGVPIVKHGNRGASSKSGAADVLEALGIPLDLTPEEVSRCLRQAGIAFCFAPRFHPGMRYAATPRRQMGVPTAFNFLGPLSNPAQPQAGAIGCADLAMAPIMAEVLAERGGSALVVRGEDGLDELTIGAPSRVWLARRGEVRETLVDATRFGMARAPVSALRGGDARLNAEIARDVLSGKPGPVRDAVVLNAAAAVTAYEGLSQDVGADLETALREAVGRAHEALDSGAAAETLARWRTVAVSSAS